MQSGGSQETEQAHPSESLEARRRVPVIDRAQFALLLSRTRQSYRWRRPSLLLPCFASAQAPNERARNRSTHQDGWMAGWAIHPSIQFIASQCKCLPMTVHPPSMLEHEASTAVPCGLTATERDLCVCVCLYPRLSSLLLTQLPLSSAAACLAALGGRQTATLNNNNKAKAGVGDVNE